MLSQKSKGALPFLLAVAIGASVAFSLRSEVVPVNSYTQAHAKIYTSSFDNKLDE